MVQKNSREFDDEIIQNPQVVLRIKEIPGGKIIIGIGSFDPIHTYFHNHQSSHSHPFSTALGPFGLAPASENGLHGGACAAAQPAGAARGAADRLQSAAWEAAGRDPAAAALGDFGWMSRDFTRK